MIYAIKMYGLGNNVLGNEDFSEFLEPETIVTLDNGKQVPITLERTEDAEFIGFDSSYPWLMGNAEISKSDVVKALQSLLVPHGYNAEEIENNLEYISTYNYV